MDTPLVPLAEIMAVAQVIRSYFESLIQAGFDTEQALILTRDFQASFIAAVLESKEED